MPNYQPNYIYSPRYGSRYMGNNTPAPATGGIGQADPLSAPVNHEAGTNTGAQQGSISTGAQGPQGSLGAPPVMSMDGNAVGWASSTGRDTSAISNLGDFGFREKSVTSDPFDEDYFKTPTNNFDPWQPAKEVPTMTGAPEISSSSSGGGDYSVPSSGGWTVHDPNDGATSGYMTHTNQWQPGNFNIAGKNELGGNWYGNQKGYEGSKAVQLGLGLKDYPVWLPGGLIAQGASNLLIGADQEDIGGHKTWTTRGSFAEGAFSGADGEATDVSGGAYGSNLAVNKHGDKVSLGYGYGQVDPAIARAAGFNVAPNIRKGSFEQDKAISLTGMNSADQLKEIEANRAELEKTATGRHAIAQAETTRAHTIVGEKASKFGVDVTGMSLGEAQNTIAKAETNHNMAVTQAKNAGVDTSGTTAQINARIKAAADAALAKNSTQGSSSLSTTERAAVVAATGKSPPNVQSPTSSGSSSSGGGYYGDNSGGTNAFSGKSYTPKYDFNPNDFTSNYGGSSSSSSSGGK